MRRRSTPALVLMVLVLHSACGGEPQLDASSADRLESSLENVRQSLPEDRRAEFDSAYQKVALAGEDLFSLSALAAASGDELPESIKQRLHGKTASDVFWAADSIRREDLKDDVESLQQRISNLETEKKRVERAEKNLRDFQVLRSRFYEQENALGMEEAIIDLTVKNETGTAISRVFFTGTLKSPDRTIPWVDSEPFNYEISGGVEPGERQRWRLKPNMFLSEWSDVDAPDEAELSVQVVELRGPEGETLWSSRDFGDEEQSELDSLRTHLDSLQTVLDSLERD